MSLAPQNNLSSSASVSDAPSNSLRDRLRAATLARTGLTPYEWQLDVAEALVQDKDAILIAGTGCGKTLAYVMPCFIDPKTTVIIVSPLNALEQNQAAQFSKWGLRATAVNAKTLSETPKLIEGISGGFFQVVITSPENLRSPQMLRPVLTNPEFTKQLKVVVDEAHCIYLWGPKFRPAWDQIGDVRKLVPHRVPFLGSTATAPPVVLDKICTSLHIDKDDHVFVNLGMFRENLVWEVNIMDASRPLVEQLDFLIPNQPTIENFQGDERILIYVNSRDIAHIICYYLRRLLPPHLRDRVAVFHAMRSDLAKEWLLYGFVNGLLKIMICTEAAGMGCDFPRVHLVLQFKTPDSLISWVQRGGRGGRDGMRCVCRLLVEPSIVAQKGHKSVEEHASGKCDEDGTSSDGDEMEVVYQKKCDTTLREYIMSKQCRWKFKDDYFQNPPHGEPTAECCDNCRNDASQPPEPRTIPPAAVPVPNQHPPTPQVPATAPRAHNRTGEHLKAARVALLDWRMRAWKRDWQKTTIYPQTLLPDKVLDAVAKSQVVQTIDDFSRLTTPPWMLAADYGAEVIALLDQEDSKHERAKQEAAMATQAVKEAQAQLQKRMKDHKARERLKDKQRKVRTDYEAQKKKRARYEACINANETWIGRPPKKASSHSPTPPSSPTPFLLEMGAQAGPSGECTVLGSIGQAVVHPDTHGHASGSENMPPPGTA
ncbi:hypothetical protein BOTBODRAFT_149878 [Botryobasidium botryosum FD-172 SS1]|uniref:DNA 3'-5' helicase n=1 Tax=Botryobasidium botryosum (strain FD-172 SS1) TaxID=930990 RepID=A0A067M1V6_BOTB1|nr:hypothetical protein BOTBODRAFT_149878 [Botryobasidium botryosum FD-172 SS1]